MPNVEVAHGAAEKQPTRRLEASLVAEKRRRDRRSTERKERRPRRALMVRGSIYVWSSLGVSQWCRGRASTRFEAAGYQAHEFLHPWVPSVLGILLLLCRC